MEFILNSFDSYIWLKMDVVEYATTKYGKPSAIYKGYRFRPRSTASPPVNVTG